MDKIKKILKENRKIILISIAAILLLISIIIIVSSKKIDRRKAGEVIATVNKFKVYRSDLDLRLKTLSQDYNLKLEDLPENIVRAMVMEVYINNKIDNQAKKYDYWKDKEVVKLTEEYKKNIIREKFINDKIFSTITEERVRAEYDRLVKSLEGKEERKISHILVESKNDAERARRSITSSDRFARVARERSIDKASAENSGSLGYVLKEELVPEFGDVAFILKVGEISKPVQTQFGWHIIKVDDIRPATFAPYDEVKENLAQRLKQEAVQKFLENETQNADVKINVKSNQQSLDSFIDEQIIEVDEE